MAKIVKSVFVLCMIIAIVCGRPNDLQELFQKHFQQIGNFPCSLPQKRSFAAAKVTDNLIFGEILIPHTTVLHRCDHAGCCPTQMECVPRTSERVQLVFSSMGRNESKNLRKFKVFEAINHTSCHCQRIFSVSKREEFGIEL